MENSSVVIKNHHWRPNKDIIDKVVSFCKKMIINILLRLDHEMFHFH